MSNRTEPIIVEQKFKNTISEVWNAITHLDEMRQWYFENIPAFQPLVGFETQFDVKSGQRNFLHMWKITEVIPLQKIVCSWKYKEYQGEGRVTFELFEDNEIVTLRLTNEGLHTFPEEIPEFARESCVGGWNYFIKERLKAYLGKRVKK